MPNFKLSQIGLIMLGVEDVTQSLAFYRDQLGLTIQMQFEGFAFLDGGGITLVLSTGLKTAMKLGPGATEIVFSVESVRTACEGLKANGVTFLTEPRPVSGPMWAANFHDPDGHLLSVYGTE